MPQDKPLVMLLLLFAVSVYISASLDLIALAFVGSVLGLLLWQSSVLYFALLVVFRSYFKAAIVSPFACPSGAFSFVHIYL